MRFCMKEEMLLVVALLEMEDLAPKAEGRAGSWDSPSAAGNGLS